MCNVHFDVQAKLCILHYPVHCLTTVCFATSAFAETLVTAICRHCLLCLALSLFPLHFSDGQGGGSQVDEREWFRSTSSHLEDNSSQALPRLSGETEYPGLTSRHLGEFSVDGGDGASTFGGSSVTGGVGQHMRSSHSRHLEAHSGKMSLLQVWCMRSCSMRSWALRCL